MGVKISQESCAPILSEEEIGLASSTCELLLRLDKLFEQELNYEEVRLRREATISQLRALSGMTCDIDAQRAYLVTLRALEARNANPKQAARPRLV